MPLPRPMRYMHDEALRRAAARAGCGRDRRARAGRALRWRLDRRDLRRRACAIARVRGVVLIARAFLRRGREHRQHRAIARELTQQAICARGWRAITRDVDVAFRGWNDAWLDPRFRAFDITRRLRGIAVPVLALQGARRSVRHARRSCDAAGTRCGAMPVRDRADRGRAPRAAPGGGGSATLDADRAAFVAAACCATDRDAVTHDRLPDRSRRATATGGWRSTARSRR